MLYFTVVLLSATLHAQDLIPELAAPAAKHKTALEGVDRQKQEASAKAAQMYMAALGSAEKSATSAGQLAVVAAIVKERDAINAATLTTEMPAALPRKLQSTRKALLLKLEQINADSSRRRKQVDADYLRVLASLQSAAASNPELAKQLAAEKIALLEGGSGKETKKPLRGMNVVVNGTFEKMSDGKPDGWQKSAGMSFLTENGNTFVRFNEKDLHTDGSKIQHDFFQEQDIDVPPGTTTLAFSAKIRVKDCVTRVRKEPQSPRINVLLKDKHGKIRFVAANWEGKNCAWQTLQAETAITPETVKVCIVLTNGYCTGLIDFDDVEATFN